MTVKTGIKGLVLCKLVERTLCPLKLVYSIFERIASDKLPVCRNIIRIMPLMRTCYPNLEELSANAKILVWKTYRPGGLGDFGVGEPTILGKRKASNPDPSHAEDEEAAVKCSTAVEAATTATDAPASELDSALVSEIEAAPAEIEEDFKIPEYCVQFRRRNHNILLRSDCQDAIRAVMPQSARVNYKAPKVCYLIYQFQNVT